MTNTTQNPFVRWRSQHPTGSIDVETEIGMQQWVHVNHELLALFDAYDETIEPWLNGQTPNLPDLVAFIAGYGYSRTVTGNWNKLPIDIPGSELDDWRDNSGLSVTLEELHGDQAGVAGSVAEMLGVDLDRVIQLIKYQLKKRYEELNTIATQPLESFAPTQWDEDEAADQTSSFEIKKLDRIFDLYEELWCFEQGIEELRMLMITEDDPEFKLPNQSFYNGLVSIDSHELLDTLNRAEGKLREVLQLWSKTVMSYTGKPYHRPYDKTAPDVFWWRHKSARGDRPR